MGPIKMIWGQKIQARAKKSKHKIIASHLCSQVQSDEDKTEEQRNDRKNGRESSKLLCIIKSHQAYRLYGDLY